MPQKNHLRKRWLFRQASFCTACEIIWSKHANCSQANETGPGARSNERSEGELLVCCFLIVPPLFGIDRLICAVYYFSTILRRIRTCAVITDGKYISSIEWPEHFISQKDGVIDAKPRLQMLRSRGDGEKEQQGVVLHTAT